MHKKSTTILYIIILIVVLAMFCGTTYSYYKRVIKKDEANVTVKVINLLVEYDNGSKINLNNFKYDEEYIHTFSIINDSEDEIARIERGIIDHENDTENEEGNQDKDKDDESC